MMAVKWVQMMVAKMADKMDVTKADKMVDSMVVM